VGVGAMDERMVASVSSGFLTKMDQLEKNHCMCWKLPGLRGLVGFSDIYSLTAPRALLCQNGLKERPSWFSVPVAREALKEIARAYADFKRPEDLAFVAHEGGHEIDLPSLVTFFRKHLTLAEKEPGALRPVFRNERVGVLEHEPRRDHRMPFLTSSTPCR